MNRTHPTASARHWPTIALGLLLFAGTLLLAATPSHAAGTLQRLKASGTLKVCIWPDYYGVTWRNPRSGELSGIDVDLSAALAHDLGVKPEYVESSFPRLIEDVLNERCDVAMFAVGVLPARAQKLSFSRPYLQSDIYGITTRSNRAIRGWDDIDRPGIQVGIQAGTFMEPVMLASLKQAKAVIIRPPQTREQELEAGRIDVFMTDYPYSRRLLDNADWARLISSPQPFHVLPYAYAVKPGDEAWAKRVDEFVQQIQTDGRLETAARRAGLAEIVVRASPTPAR